MKILGIDFEPLNTPIQRHIEAISALLVFNACTALFAEGIAIALFILIFTPFSIFTIVYVCWIWLDLPTTQKGGRKSDWVRGWKLFKYAKDYYPITLTTVPDVNLNPKKNYLFAAFPHAIFPGGSIIALGTKACGVEEIFPNHTVYAGTLDINLKSPFYRDFLMAIGFCSVSAESLNYLLQYPYGGKITVVIVGGAAEAYLSQPGEYKIILKNRRGFVKLAIKNGTPLVPVYSFGENDVFNQYIPPEESLLHKFQEWVKNFTSFSLPIFYGRGVLQKTFGIVPLRKPINVVVGKPIDVVKNENPTREEVNALHQIFMDEMTKLFEENKHKYIEDAVNKKLVIL